MHVPGSGEQVATEKDYRAPLELTRRTAREAGTQAWMYNLENQYEKL